MLGHEHSCSFYVCRSQFFVVSFLNPSARTEIVGGGFRSQARASLTPQSGPAFPVVPSTYGCEGRGWVVLPAFALERALVSGFLSGVGHNRCWFGLALILCRHLPTSQSPRVWQVCGNWQSLPGQSPVLEQRGLQVHWHMVVGNAPGPCLPSAWRCSATPSHPWNILALRACHSN